MVATQVAVGQGKISNQEISDHLQPGAQSVQGLAHPGGLFLVNVSYPQHRLSGTLTEPVGKKLTERKLDLLFDGEVERAKDIRSKT